ncbi:MAG: glycosyltransferase family 4 protein [Chloroflexi bacterium]|nr:glycosyltransferase family 4 protein [Chloroflexota bacterium]
MRIAFNGSFWNKPTTGSGQYLRALLTTLGQRALENDYAVILLSAVSGLPSIPRVRFQSEQVALARVNDNFAKLWFEQVTFARACQRERADLAHVPYFASPLFPRTRTIVTVHDLIPMLLPLYRGSVQVRAYTQLVAVAAHRANAIIADSECSKRDIVRHLGIDAARVQVVYLAADARYRPADNAQIEIVRQKYSLPDKFLLYLGGYDQRKNVRVIIQAFAQLRDLYSSGYRLVLAGTMLGKDSDFFPDPRRIAREANLTDDAICYLGWVDEADKPALYSSAISFLFASIYEGFGLPPLEAMACGTPVISSNTSSLPEIVGNAGITIDPNDVAAWAHAMREVVTDSKRRAEMSKLGIDQARKFSWEQTATETLRIYQTVVG